MGLHGLTTVVRKLGVPEVSAECRQRHQTLAVAFDHTFWDAGRQAIDHRVLRARWTAAASRWQVCVRLAPEPRERAFVEMLTRMERCGVYL
ncbi:MAG: hypothetical protein WCI73_04520 [Phycisphaerae bacterium]